MTWNIRLFGSVPPRVKEKNPETMLPELWNKFYCWWDRHTSSEKAGRYGIHVMFRHETLSGITDVEEVSMQLYVCSNCFQCRHSEEEMKACRTGEKKCKILRTLLSFYGATGIAYTFQKSSLGYQHNSCTYHLKPVGIVTVDDSWQRRCPDQLVPSPSVFTAYIL